MKKYIDDRIFTKEIIISKGKGRLTKNAEIMLYKLAVRVFRVNTRMPQYKNNIFYDDIKSGGVEAALKGWKTFNHLKYDSAFNYMTEIIKRGQTQVFNQAICNKDWQGNTFFTIYFDFWNPGEKKKEQFY